MTISQLGCFLLSESFLICHRRTPPIVNCRRKRTGGARGRKIQTTSISLQTNGCGDNWSRDSTFWVSGNVGWSKYLHLLFFCLSSDFPRTFSGVSTAGTKVKFSPGVVFWPPKVNALQVVLYNRPLTSWEGPEGWYEHLRCLFHLPSSYQSCIGSTVELPNVYVDTANAVHCWTGGLTMQFKTCVSVFSPSEIMSRYPKIGKKDWYHKGTTC